MEGHREIHPVPAGRLEDDAHGRVGVLGQPVHDMRVPVRSVVDGLPAFPPIGAEQVELQLGLAGIDTQRRLVH
jgi:hypothetical protein